jgi:purine-binding chemotaxis protein CheW
VTTALARAGTHDEEPQSRQYLTFVLAGELYAVPIETIREVVEFHGLTRIPLAPAVVPGVLNLRGSVVPVVDLAVRFGSTATAIGRRTCVVIVETETDEGLQPMGLIVDAVSEALEINPQQLEQRPAFGTGLRRDFVLGMLNLADRFVVVLDMRVVLSLSELEQLVSGAIGADARTNSSASQEHAN